MDRKEAKLQFLKIFSETKYETAYIDEEFIANYISLMWKNTFDNCKREIRSGGRYITVDDFTVPAFSGHYPPHEKAAVYEHMLPYVQQELDDAEIPYTTELSISKVIRFKIAIEDLKKFSNVEMLETLL